MSEVWRQEYIGPFTLGRQTECITLSLYGYGHAREGDDNKPYITWGTQISPAIAIEIATMLITLAMMEQPDEEEER